MPFQRIWVALLIVGCASPLRISDKQFKLRRYKETALENGLKLLFLEDNSLPYFTINMLLKTGYASQPAGKKGIANFVSQLMDKGTNRRTALEIADELGQLGADFGIDVAPDYTTVVSSGLSRDREKIIELFSDMILHPAFRESEVKRLKKQILAELQKRTDDPSNFAGQSFADHLFGEHPYGTPAMGTKKNVETINRSDVIRYYLKYYRPNNAILSVVGKFGANIETEIAAALKGWKPRKLKVGASQPFPEISGIQVRLVHKADLAQTQIRMGHKGIQRSNPKFLELRLANMILGRGFSSRLVDHVRDKMGLTYSIGSSIDARRDLGPFFISTFTRNEKAGDTVSETLRILDRFVKEGVTEQEVRDAKGSLFGLFPKALETSEKLAFNLLLLRNYSIGDEYLTRFKRNVNRITTRQVNLTIKEYFSAKNIKILVFANKDKVLDQLKFLGPIEVVDYKTYL